MEQDLNTEEENENYIIMLSNKSFMYDFPNHFFSNPTSDSWSTSGINWYSEQDEKQYVLFVSAPGSKRENFKLEVQEDLLELIHSPPEEEQTQFNSYFSKSFRLSDKLSKSNIEAKYDNGILKITIPVKEKELNKIEIQ